MVRHELRPLAIPPSATLRAQRGELIIEKESRVLVPQQMPHRIRSRDAKGILGMFVPIAQFNLGDMYAESGQTSQGSFSAVSKPNFASKYSLE